MRRDNINKLKKLIEELKNKKKQPILKKVVEEKEESTSFRLKKIVEIED